MGIRLETAGGDDDALVGLDPDIAPVLDAAHAAHPGAVADQFAHLEADVQAHAAVDAALDEIGG